MQNLKQLRFRVYSDESQKAHLKVKGEQEVKGSNFELPSTVELVNKNAHLATLTAKSAELEMEIQIEKGIGYSPREARKKEKLEIGAIPLDAIFTPVKRVSYKIENMRVGERTDFDRLFLEIETDGVTTPEAAFAKASEILVKHFSLFTEALAKEEKKKSSLTGETFKKTPKKVSPPATKRKRAIKKKQPAKKRAQTKKRKKIK